MFRRILLKLSGEAIEGEHDPFDHQVLLRIAGEVRQVQEAGTAVGIVIGGGNILRGGALEKLGFDRVRSDSMGMLATVINSIMLSEALRAAGVPAVVQSAFPVSTMVSAIDLDVTARYLDEGKVVLFAGGTGSPFFTTDTAAALRACEIGADLLLKATKVEGVYDRDPVLHPDAELFKHLTYDQVLARRLKVMDMTAISLCREHRIPVVVFNIFRDHALLSAVKGEHVGTLLKE